MANCSSYTLPAYLWTVFSTLTAIICPMGLYYSNWLQRTTPEGTYNSLSSYRLCLNETSQVSTSCQAYFSFNEIYSSEWKAITLLMGIGACCLIFVGVMSLFGLCIRKLFNIYVTILVVLLQSLGVVLYFISIVVFPAGISDQARHPMLCGSEASSFKLGHCTIGWAYIMTMVGTGAGAVAAGLSWTPGRWKEKHRKGGYTL